MTHEPNIANLKPWSLTLAIEERVQYEDTVRWARKEDGGARETTTRTFPDAAPVKRAFITFVNDFAL